MYGNGDKNVFILLLRNDNLCRFGTFYIPRTSVISFYATYNSCKDFMFAIPLSFLNLFFLSSRIIIELLPFQVISVI